MWLNNKNKRAKNSTALTQTLCNLPITFWLYFAPALRLKNLHEDRVDNTKSHCSDSTTYHIQGPSLDEPQNTQLES